MTTIRTRELTKRFGAVTAVRDLDLDVERVKVFGFLGPNGAGKTTTIRMLLDIVRPTSGWAEILGVAPLNEALRSPPCAEPASSCPRSAEAAGEVRQQLDQNAPPLSRRSSSTGRTPRRPTVPAGCHANHAPRTAPSRDVKERTVGQPRRRRT
jgi:ABC-type cobalamin/Fe3+-siderophores transport system ATPase subunit